MRLRRVSAGNMNQTFSKDGEEDKKVANHQGRGVEEMAKVANQGRGAEEKEEMNTTYSLADVSLTRSALNNYCLLITFLLVSTIIIQPTDLLMSL